MKRCVDLSGKKFGRWTIVSRTSPIGQVPVRWLCVCECGSEKERGGRSIADGRSKSCGCLAREVHTRHSMSRSKEYRLWHGIIQRCHNINNKAYANYGGRGVFVCDEWRGSFDAFFREVGRRPSVAHSLDRIDNDKGYEPSNCRWATRSEQALNRRVTVMIEIDGVKKNLREWSAISGVPFKTIYYRLFRGWSPKDAVYRPARGAGKSKMNPLSVAAAKRIWDGMKSRCHRPQDKDYPKYGGAGVTVCQRWRDSFDDFMADIGPRPSADHTVHRIDNTLGYSPENCKWATRREQQGNRTISRMLTHAGRTQCMTAWAREIGVPYFLIQNRLNVLGWSIEDALTIPKGGRRKRHSTNSEQQDTST